MMWGIVLAAQTTAGTIAVVIQDSAGGVLVSAKVVIDPSQRQAAADEQGNFRMANVPPGQYTVTASYVGFAPYTATVQVTPGQVVTVTARLQVSSGADSVI